MAPFSFSHSQWPCVVLPVFVTKATLFGGTIVAMTDDTVEAREREDFQVGGHERKLSPEQQLTQMSTYIEAHYPAPGKNPPWSDDPSDPGEIDHWDALLPDRLTHTAMVMLGSAVDHAMPGVKYPGNITVEDIPELNAQVFIPSNPNGKWAISLHPGGWWKGAGKPMNIAWRPEVAGAAELSGTTIVDLDYPLLPEATLDEVIAFVADAAAWVRENKNPSSLAAWGYSSGGALAVLASEHFDSLALTFPHLDLSMLPADLRGDNDFPASVPPTFMQVASNDAIAGHYPDFESLEGVSVKEYVSEHRISTPKVARERVKDIAEYLK